MGRKKLRSIIIPIRLDIDEIHYDVGDCVTTVCFVSSYGSSVGHLLLQNADQFDIQDVTLGMNKAYVEYCDQINSQYGGIQNITIENDELRFRFADDSYIAKQLETREIVLSYAKDIVNLNMALDFLKVICKQDCIENNFEK